MVLLPNGNVEFFFCVMLCTVRVFDVSSPVSDYITVLQRYFYENISLSICLHISIDRDRQIYNNVLKLIL